MYIFFDFLRSLQPQGERRKSIYFRKAEWGK